MPTLVCVPIMVESIEQARADADAARSLGCSLVEYRLDGLLAGVERGDGGGVVEDLLAGAVELVTGSAVPCIATCRLACEGGHYSGDEAVRIELFGRLINSHSPPRCVDIELAAWTGAMRKSITRALASSRTWSETGTTLILSTHDFDRRPADLSRRLLAIHDEPAGVIKVAYRARSLRDNLDLFELLTHRDRPMIALGMGPFGLMSRVLAGKFGSLLTFAALDHDHATAPGQPTLAQLTTLYRIDAIGPATRVYGVVGWPVEHSLSPAIHNAGFERLGHDGVYLPLPIPAGESAGDARVSLKATLGALVDDRRLDLAGVSVTIPHKVHLVELATASGWSVDPLVAAIGAGNTLVIDRDDSGAPIRVEVRNTDAHAARDCLTQAMDELTGSTIAIIGAGGVARAVAAACASAGGRVLILNRTQNRAQQLVRDLAAGGISGVQAVEELPADAVDAVVNATPIGMVSGPEPTGMPIALEPLANRAESIVVFDTVYTPQRTPWIQRAGELGFRCVTGRCLFVRQAAAQCAAWTGQQPPVELFDRIVTELSS